MPRLLAARAPSSSVDRRSRGGGIDGVLCAINFGVWARADLYSKTWGGLVASYVAAIPFFHNMMLGDMLYSSLLFDGLALIEQGRLILREPEPGSAR